MAMRFPTLSAVLVFLSYLLCARLATRAQDDEEFKVNLLPVTPQIEESASKAVKGCEPQAGKVVAGINKNGVYTLTGELFHNGRLYSVIDDNEDVILCEWQKAVWKPISVLNIHTVWNFPPGYRKPIIERGTDEQPVPFWMLNLKDRPLLVIASWVEKEGQNYFVILFDSKCERILDTTPSFGLQPTVKYQYLITGDSSRVKGDWQATYFSRIENNAFVVKKSWENSVPWHAEFREDQPDDSSNYASSNGKGYVILPYGGDSKHPADYSIYRSDSTEKQSVLGRINETSGKPFVAIKFMPEADDDGEEELGYLFEKLTGLPLDLYPDYDRLGMKGISRPQWKINVTGSDPALIRLLSSTSK